MMAAPRHLPLYDPNAHPSSWNERMATGEYAVHYAGSHPGTPGTCAVLPSLPEAEAYAAEQIRLHPSLQCRIYDHHGMVGAPLREITGPAYKGNTDITPRMRRWLGLGLLIAGVGLITLDCTHGFRLMWAYTLGLPLLLPGAVLVVIEALTTLTAKRRARTSTPAQGA
jgi:hypothetical protein